MRERDQSRVLPAQTNLKPRVIVSGMVAKLTFFLEAIKVDLYFTSAKNTEYPISTGHHAV